MVLIYIFHIYILIYYGFPYHIFAIFNKLCGTILVYCIFYLFKKLAKFSNKKSINLVAKNPKIKIF